MCLSNIIELSVIMVVFSQSYLPLYIQDTSCILYFQYYLSCSCIFNGVYGVVTYTPLYCVCALWEAILLWNLHCMDAWIYVYWWYICTHVVYWSFMVTLWSESALSFICSYIMFINYLFILDIVAQIEDKLRYKINSNSFLSFSQIFVPSYQTFYRNVT